MFFQNSYSYATMVDLYKRQIRKRMINYMTIQHNSLPKDGMKYVDLNAILNMLERTRDGRQLYQLDKEKEAVEAFINDYVTPRMMKFDSYAERVHYLVDEGYYSGDVLRQYDDEFMESLRSQLEKVGFEFKSFIGALKFYKQYALKTWESNVNEEVFLEDYKDRATIVALYLAGGDKEIAFDIAREIISGRFQPATPTYLNSGRNDSGELVSCFPAGTPIDTIEGQVSIEDIEPGDMVLSHDGGYHEVEELIENSNNKNLVSLKHYGHSNPIISTPEHPILVHTKRDVTSLIDGDGSDIDKEIVWLQAQDIEPGDFVIVTGPVHENESYTHNILEFIPGDEFVGVDGVVKKPNIDRKLRKINEYSKSFVEVNQFINEDYNLGLILGWYISEGHVSKRKNKDGIVTINGAHFTLGSHETDFIIQLSSALNKVFGVEAKSNSSNYDGSTRISVHSRAVGEFLYSMSGTGYGDKRLTKNILESNLEFQRGILHGAFRGDGHCTNGSLALDLANKEIIDSIQLILHRNGIISRVRTYTNNAGNIASQLIVPGIPGENEEFIYSVNKNLDNYVGLKGTGKNLKNSVFYKMIHGHIGYEVSDSKVLQDKPEKVYNLHVKDTHTYSVRGVIVHNCYLLRTEDNMESIGQTVTRSLQLSKRGGGVGICLTNLREVRGSIKGFKGLASGPVPVMKILEDSFSYADQLG